MAKPLWRASMGTELPKLSGNGRTVGIVGRMRPEQGPACGSMRRGREVANRWDHAHNVAGLL